MASDPNRPDWGRYVVIEWAKSQARAIGPTADDLIGKCPTCGEWRRRRETAPNHAGGEPCHVCRTCGSVIDEVPF